MWTKNQVVENIIVVSIVGIALLVMSPFIGAAIVTLGALSFPEAFICLLITVGALKGWLPKWLGLLK